MGIYSTRSLCLPCCSWVSLGPTCKSKPAVDIAHGGVGGVLIFSLIYFYLFLLVYY
jgi:hypothetical protein